MSGQSPNTGVEARACGAPMIGFHTGGLQDIVEHRRTGYLAKAFETIARVLEQRVTGQMGMEAQGRVKERFAALVVAGRYQQIYKHMR